MTNIVVVGQGYVGIPLAIEFGKIFPTVGFDISAEKIASLCSHIAPGGEVESKELQSATFLSFSDDPSCLALADFIILAVPTLVNAMHQPDLNPLLSASKMVGKYMRAGVTIVYESTVYPGATEEVCIPALEESSGLKWMNDFHVGYSPERVNPGDKKHSLVDIVKIVSGDSEQTLEKVTSLYEKIIRAGLCRVSCIKVAEAAKVVENTQRDLNIGLMNEVAIISNLIGIDSKEVIDAASTKWNFIPMRPGLVGGHCIGVVPYYLTYKAEMLGYHPDVILAGRRINDGMGKFIADQTIKQMIARGIVINGAKVCILGLAFKPNVQDLSNSKVINVIKELESFGVQALVHDPIVPEASAKAAYGINLINWEDIPPVDALIFAISHNFYLQMPISKLTSHIRPKGCFIDIQSAFPKKIIEDAGFAVWRL